MNKEQPKVYEPQQVESRIYQMWEDHDSFKGVEAPRRSPFSIVMPAPPTSQASSHRSRAGLHPAGHPDPLQAVRSTPPSGPRHRPRRHRHPEQGEEELRVKEGKTRYDLAREVPGAVWKWKEEYATESSSSRRRWRFPATEPAPALPWTGCSKAVPGDLPASLGMTKGLITRQPHQQLVPHALPALSDPRWSMRTKPGHGCGKYPLSSADGLRDIVVANHPSRDP